mmetsp:Transcript_18852/g.60182  ORF Transcript_18852/g.60182 Transcript_18852/m.60182 type:complete len:292 (+) Transcript_18852:978-1853(+)
MRHAVACKRGAVDGHSIPSARVVETTVPAFKHRHDPALAGYVGDPAHLARDPGKVLALQVKAAAVPAHVTSISDIATAGVKASRDENQVRAEHAQRREKALFDDPPELGPAKVVKIEPLGPRATTVDVSPVAPPAPERLHGRVDDVGGCVALVPAARVELVRGAGPRGVVHVRRKEHEGGRGRLALALLLLHGLLVDLVDDLLSAVAVVHVKIDDRHSLDLVRELGHGMHGSDGHVVEDAEPARARVLKQAVDPRVVARRPDHTERVPLQASHHLVDRMAHRAAGAKSGVQ